MDIQKLYKLYLESAGVSTDSRNIMPGQLFFALSGSNFNGNLYAGSALEKGALAAIIDDKKYREDERSLLVDNSLKCLQELAAFHRKKLGIPLIAITGSNGKTTTKELMAAVLSRKFRIHYTKGNLNNHIGVPLTLLEMKDPEFAIIEMGANHPGEIKELCEIADPDFGCITNIGRAHLEGFGSVEGVLNAKSELYEYLAAKEAKVFINGTNELLKAKADLLNLEQVSYYQGDNLQCDGYSQGQSLLLKAMIRFINGREWALSTRLTGDYNLENILAAACTGKYLGIDEESIIGAIAAYTPANSRSQVIESKSNRIILDAYNANPDSMQNAIVNFAGQKDKRKLVVLGEMAELGEHGHKEHKSVLDILQRYSFSGVYLSGKSFHEFRDDYNFHFFQDTKELFEHFKINPVIDHFILLKSSRAGKFESLLEVL